MSNTSIIEDVETEVVEKHKLYPHYRVLYHNDSVSTFEFVIMTLKEFFNKNEQEAKNIAQEVHKTGVGLAGIYQRELAELKQEQVHSKARAFKFPLTLSLEPVE